MSDTSIKTKQVWPETREVAPENDSHGLKITLDTLALLAALAALLGLTPVPPTLAALLVGFFVLAGPGLAIVTWFSLPLSAIVAATPVLGLSMIAGSTVTLAWLDISAPTELLLCATAFVVFSVLLHAGTHSRRPIVPILPRFELRQMLNGPLVWTMAILVVWVILLPRLADLPYSQFGLLFVGAGPGLVVVTVATVLGFVLAIRVKRLGTAVFAVSATIVVQRVTVTLITDAPLYPWTYKHIGVVDFLLRNQALPPEGVDIYRGWPAFFTTSAWFSQITSLDPISLAHWFAPIVHILLALTIGATALLVGLEVRQALTAVMIAELVNWVGQDYFAPQAMAIVMALGMLALLIASNGNHRSVYLALLVFAALVPTHQLTPYWLLVTVVLLVITRRIKSWWLPIPCVGLLVLYLVPRMDMAAPQGLISGLNPVSNASGNMEYVGSLGKVFTSTTCRSLSAAVVISAAVCAFVWWRQGRPVGIPAVVAFSSLTLLLLQNYGGEAIFRVYLYAVPGCSILIAPVLVAGIKGSDLGRGIRHGWGVLSVSVAVLIAAACAGLQGYYGTWFLVVEHRSQVDLAAELLDGTDGRMTITTLYPAGFPTRVTGSYVRFAQQDLDFDLPLEYRWNELFASFPDTGQLDELTDWAAGSSADTYFVFTRQGNDALAYYRYFREGAVEEFEQQFAQSDQWQLRMRDDFTAVYRFTGAKHRAGS